MNINMKGMTNEKVAVGNYWLHPCTHTTHTSLCLTLCHNNSWLLLAFVIVMCGFVYVFLGEGGGLRILLIIMETMFFKSIQYLHIFCFSYFMEGQRKDEVSIYSLNVLLTEILIQFYKFLCVRRSTLSKLLDDSINANKTLRS